MTVSAVIPTRNRVMSLVRLLSSLARQSVVPDEIIVVDAGDPDSVITPGDVPPGLDVTLIRSEPSVCRQRNMGIRHATGDIVFLCDDDMEPGPEYVKTLISFVGTPDDPRMASGMITESDREGNRVTMPRMPFRRIVWNWFFGLSVWTDLREVHVPLVLRPLWWVMKRSYVSGGNGRTGAGWPVVTQVEGSSFTTAFFGLGASLTYRSVLLSNPFDETLDDRGIGDHYELLDRLGSSVPVVVATSVSAHHHRSTWSELADIETYARRVLVLDAVRHRRGAGRATEFLLLWSLVGNYLAFLLTSRRDHARTSFSLLRLILGGRNPYRRTLGISGPAPAASAILPGPLRT